MISFCILFGRGGYQISLCDSLSYKNYICSKRVRIMTELVSRQPPNFVSETAGLSLLREPEMLGSIPGKMRPTAALGRRFSGPGILQYPGNRAACRYARARRPTWGALHVAVLQAYCSSARHKMLGSQSGRRKLWQAVACKKPKVPNLAGLGPFTTARPGGRTGDPDGDVIQWLS